MEGIGQKKETDYIFDKTIKCDVCGKEFKTKQVRTGKARFIGTDDILKPLYEGIDTCKYDIIMCPHCGYAASIRLFGHHTAKQRQAVRLREQYTGFLLQKAARQKSDYTRIL